MADNLNPARESANLSLSIPLLDPGIRTHSGVNLLEVIASLKFFTFDLLAPVEIKVALIAIP